MSRITRTNPEVMEMESQLQVMGDNEAVVEVAHNFE